MRDTAHEHAPVVAVAAAAARTGPSSPLDQIRSSATTLLREQKGEEALTLVLDALDAVLRKSRDLELLVAKLRKQQLGQRSERVDAAQLALLFEQLQQQGQAELASVDVAAEQRADADLDQEIKAAQAATTSERRTRKQRKTRMSFPGAEHREQHVELSEQQRTCASCGQTCQQIGKDVARRVEYVPGHFVVHEEHLANYGCATCRDGVLRAPGPQRILDRCIAGPSLLAHVVVGKYVDHLPFHRLSHSYARAGAQIPVSTLSDWSAGVADLCEPLVERLGHSVLAAHVVRTDATGLKVLDPHSPKNIERGTIWAYLGDRDVVFRYTKTGEGATGPWLFLAGRAGPIQADGANVFDRLFNGEVASAIEVGCLAHARRKFVELQDTDCRVAYPLALIRRIYRIEQLADARECTPSERTALRQQRTLPILEQLKRWAVITQAQEPPGSQLAKATAYLLNQWDALSRFASDGLLSPDNNKTEQQLRTIALGRKNYLFAGSHRAAERIATLYSITRTCGLHGVPPLAYLTDVLPKLANGWPQARIDELLPGNWTPTT